jgi:hypothetical protein
MRALLASVRPDAAALLVPSRDDRRALLAACAAAKVPTVYLRTGEDEEPERSDGGPRPDLVLAWNGSASPEDLREALREAARGGRQRAAASGESPSLAQTAHP